MVTQITQHEQQWDAFVQKHGGNFLQSWDWARFQESLGRKTFRFRVDSAAADGVSGAGEAHTVAQFVMLELPLPLGRRYLYVPRGPVVAVTDVGPDAARANLESAVEALRERARQSGATFARVEWPWTVASVVTTAEQSRAWGFNEAGHVQPQHTVINDLTLGEETALQIMHQKTRYNIRVAQKHGVTVRETLARGNAEQRAADIDAFWKMLDETASRDGFSTHEKGYYAKMIELLGGPRTGDDTGLRVRLYLAEYQGRAIAGALTAEFGDTVTYLHGASTNADRNVMSPYLLHWEIMRAGKAVGFRNYDFWGVAPENADNHPWAGITRFKLGFGGQRASYLGAWELPLSKFWYGAYRLAKRLRR